MSKFDDDKKIDEIIKTAKHGVALYLAVASYQGESPGGLAITKRAERFLRFLGGDPTKE